MRIGLLKMEEAGSEEVTTVGGEDPSTTPNTDPDSPDFNYDAWMADDAVADETYPDEVEEQEPQEVDEPEQPESDDTPEKEESEEITPEDPEPVVEKWTIKTSKGELEYDPSDVEATKAWVQKGMDAQQKWQEAAEIRNQSYKFMESLKRNPFDILTNPALGLNVVEQAEKFLFDHYQDEKLKSENPDAYAIKEENKRLKAAERKRELEAQQSQVEADNKRLAERDQVMKDTIEASGLPLNHQTFYLANAYLKQAEQAGHDVEPKDVMDYVKRDFVEEQQKFIRAMDVKQLEELLGKDLLNSVRKVKIKEAKEKQPVKKQVVKVSKKEEKPRYNDLTSFLQGGR